MCFKNLLLLALRRVLIQLEGVVSKTPQLVLDGSYAMIAKLFIFPSCSWVGHNTPWIGHRICVGHASNL